MIYMLDTNILIYLIKNKPPSMATRVNELDKEPCFAFLLLAMPNYLKVLKKAFAKRKHYNN
jgi:tRNA(fMet)-specific endonuclease VapC